MNPQSSNDCATSVTDLLDSWKQGEAGAEDQLIERVYGELKKLAQSFLGGESDGHTLQATALVHEAYLRMLRQRHVDWQNRLHFFAIAGRTMRRVLLDHARGKRYLKRGGAVSFLSLDPNLEVAQPETEPALVALAEALEMLAKVDPDKATVVEMRYFGGLTVPEVAQVLQLSEATVFRHWRLARAWLLHELKEEGDAPRSLA